MQQPAAGASFVFHRTSAVQCSNLQQACSRLQLGAAFCHLEGSSSSQRAPSSPGFDAGSVRCNSLHQRALQLTLLSLICVVQLFGSLPTSHFLCSSLQLQAPSAICGTSAARFDSLQQIACPFVPQFIGAGVLSFPCQFFIVQQLANASTFCHLRQIVVGLRWATAG